MKGKTRFFCIVNTIEIVDDGKGRLFLKFGYNQKFIEKIKTIPGRTYHPKFKQWSISSNQENVNKLKPLFDQKILNWPRTPELHSKIVPSFTSLNNHQKIALSRLEQTIELMGYSKSTLRTYSHMFKDAVRAFSRYRQDIESGAYPTKKHTIKIKDEEFERFMDEVEQQG